MHLRFRLSHPKEHERKGRGEKKLCQVSSFSATRMSRFSGRTSQLMAKTTPQSLSPNAWISSDGWFSSAITHNVEILIQLQQEGDPHLAAGDVSSARTWRHAEATSFDPLLPVWFMIPSRCGRCRLFSCDGDTHMELRCRDPAGHGVLLPGRHSGVRPLEQLQRKVSGEGETFCFDHYYYFFPHSKSVTMTVSTFFFPFNDLLLSLNKRLILSCSISPSKEYLSY